MKYEKDEINFHVFLNAMRQIHNVTLEQLGEGLYTRSAMRRIENGENIPEKLMRDRIMARIGVSDENYEDYLQNEEYDRWKLRQDILNCVERKQWEELKKYLNEYESMEEHSAAEQQFLTTMWLWFYRNNGASEELQREFIERALHFTIPGTIKEFPQNMLLADQELELLIEYIQLHRGDGSITEETEWKVAQYESVLQYIDQSQMDAIGKAKIYPKAAVCFCRLILEVIGDTGGSFQKSKILKMVHRGLHICNHGISLLQDTQKLYYFVELLEIRMQFIEFLMQDFKACSKEKNAEKLLPIFNQTAEWKALITGLYEENNILPHMEHDCHIFRESKCNAIGDVVRVRRQMLGLSRQELCENICSDRALMRLENKTLKKTQMPIIRELFERLGLCAEYTRARIVTSDYEVIRMAEKAAVYANRMDVENWEECLQYLEKHLGMDNACNRQAVKSMRSSLEYQKNAITLDVFIEQEKAALNCTIPMEAVLKDGIRYLTQEEVSCIYHVGIRMFDRDNPYIPVLKQVCQQYITEDSISTKIGEYELLMTGIANYLGSMGRYDESDDTSRSSIKNSLRHRRMNFISTNLYNNLWNYQQRVKNKSLITHKMEVEEEFKKCIMLANIMKLNNRQKFYELMLEDWIRQNNS